MHHGDVISVGYDCSTVATQSNDPQIVPVTWSQTQTSEHSTAGVRSETLILLSSTTNHTPTFESAGLRNASRTHLKAIPSSK